MHYVRSQDSLYVHNNKTNTKTKKKVIYFYISFLLLQAFFQLLYHIALTSVDINYLKNQKDA